MIKYLTRDAVSQVQYLDSRAAKTNLINTVKTRSEDRTWRKLLLLFLPAVLVASKQHHGQRFRNALHDGSARLIITVPSGGKISAMLLATRDVPAGTSALPVVTNGKERSILPGLTISAPGAYPNCNCSHRV